MQTSDSKPKNDSDHPYVISEKEKILIDILRLVSRSLASCTIPPSTHQSRLHHLNKKHTSRVSTEIYVFSQMM